MKVIVDANIVFSAILNTNELYDFREGAFKS